MLPVSMSEDDLIATYFAPIAGPGGLGLKDDAALIAPPPGTDLVLTADGLIAGMHFLPDDPPASIAKKALRVNLSDLAAKGAEPLGFLLTLALPSTWTRDWLAAFAEGLREDAVVFRCPLLGGDTVRTRGPIALSITAVGAVSAGRMVPRTGVKPGDAIYVTGTVGDGALGLRARLNQARDAAWLAGLEKASREALIERYLLPRPRNALAGAACDYAHAGMDVSDGLVGDLVKILRVSGVTADIALSRVPLSPAVASAIELSPQLFEAAITGGDDYELILAVPAASMRPFEAAAAAAGVAVTSLGYAKAGVEPPVFRGADSEPRAFKRASFSHF
jgi:thiamine-monophosphate kinase